MLSMVKDGASLGLAALKHFHVPVTLAAVGDIFAVTTNA